MDVESWALDEPAADERRFVGAVIIHDDVHVEAARHVRINQIEEFAELRRAVALMKLRDHVARLRIEPRREIPA